MVLEVKQPSCGHEAMLLETMMADCKGRTMLAPLALSNHNPTWEGLAQDFLVHKTSRAFLASITVS